MNFGCSAVDLVSLVKLVWTVYDGWKEACVEYAAITVLLYTLVSSLERIKREAKRSDSALVRSKRDEEDRSELGNILAGCKPTVRELNDILLKYKSLSRSRARTWDRIRLGVKNLNEIRAKLTRHITAVNLYLNTAGITSSTRVERKLHDIPVRIQTSIDTLAEEIRAGRREGSILTTYGSDEKEVWKQLRRELIVEGMTSGFIHQHKPRIKIYLRDLASRGELEERAPIGDITSADEDDPPSDGGPREEAKAVESPKCGSSDEHAAEDLEPIKESTSAFVSPIVEADQSTASLPGRSEGEAKDMEKIAEISLPEPEQEDQAVHQELPGETQDIQQEHGASSCVAIDDGTSCSGVPDCEREAISAEEDANVLPALGSGTLAETTQEGIETSQEREATAVKTEPNDTAETDDIIATQEDLKMLVGEGNVATENAEQSSEEIARSTPKLIFKDCVGRTFKWPFERCKSWKVMESYINQAFCYIDVLGKHVKFGNYDLTEPDGAIIMPAFWEFNVRPGMEISMHMWPMEDDPLLDPKINPKAKTKGSQKGTKSADASAVNSILPPPPSFPPGFGDLMMFLPPPPGTYPFSWEQDKNDKGKKPTSNKPKSEKEGSGFAAWLTGGSWSKNPKR